MSAPGERQRDAPLCRTTPVNTRAHPDVKTAVGRSRLAALPPHLVSAMLEGSALLDVPVGAVPQRQYDPPAAGLLVSGLLRVFHTAVDGRQVTVRYARSGSLLAIPTLYAKSQGSLSQQALTPTRILVLQAERLVAIARREVAVANLFAEETAFRLFEVLQELAGNTFGTMRQRLVRHLLDLASGPSGLGSPLVARGTQQALADAVGCVREVVVRLLRDLREEGLIRTGRDQVELLDADRLAAETYVRADDRD
jgi:CRP-like cAMP-binding protein